MNFIDLKAQYERLQSEIFSRIDQVLSHGAYIMGPEVDELESKLSSYLGVKHCVTCANGTDALQLVMMALEIGPGDAVICPAFTFAATAEAVALTGATPVFADIDPRTFNISVDSCTRAIQEARVNSLTVRAVIAVDLFGMAADYAQLSELCRAEGLKLIGDSAQGFGATIHGQCAATMCDVSTTSFFPAKPLGCYGDGGAVFTNDEMLADVLTSLRVHGKGDDKYENVRIGLNSRLDTLQAGILIAKLGVYDDELTARRRVAMRYSEALGGKVVTPYLPDEFESVWAQYTIVLDSSAERSCLMDVLRAKGVPSAVYYPKPLHQQQAYRAYPVDPHGLPESESLAGRVLSLPMHPYLTESDQKIVIDAVIDGLSSCR